MQYCPQPTNGIIYFRAFSSLNSLPEELRPYVPLFCRTLTKYGHGAGLLRELEWGRRCCSVYTHKHS